MVSGANRGRWRVFDKNHKEGIRIVNREKQNRADSTTVMSELIDIISKQGKLLDFMERYHLSGLREASAEQLKEYIEEVF